MIQLAETSTGTAPIREPIRVKPTGRIREAKSARRQPHEIRPQYIRWGMGVCCTLPLLVFVAAFCLAYLGRGGDYPYILMLALTGGSFAGVLGYFGYHARLQIYGSKAETQIRD